MRSVSVTCRAVPELIMREEGAIVAGVVDTVVFLAMLRPRFAYQWPGNVKMYK